MARSNTIVLSDEEFDRLQEKREDIYGTDEVPYGVVVNELLDRAE